MTVTFGILGIIVLGSAMAAMTLRNLVHCALALTLTFAGLAALYLQLGAQFVGFAQVLIYIGAVAMLMVFAILLTRASEVPREPIFSSGWLWGVVVAVGVFGVLAGIIFSSKTVVLEPGPAPDVSVRQIGEELMTKYVLPLEILGLLLTAALIGAVLIALQERKTE